MRLATCSFGEYRPGMGVPVRTSIGHPRFWRGAQLVPLPELYPTRPMLALNLARYEPAYRAKLDGTGLHVIQKALQQIARVNPDEDRLVLLCFERFDKDPTTFCHRHIVARWWLEQTGEEVPELGTRPAAVTPAPPALF